MNDTFGLIYTGENDLDLRELTSMRAVAAMPVGGRYRVIDLLLSNLVNSGVYNIGLITQKNYHSLMDHLGSGKDWDLDRKDNGLFIQPPYVTRDNTGSYEGLLDAVRSNMGYIRRTKDNYCMLMGSHTVFNASFDDMRDFHMRNKADITVMYNRPTEPVDSDASRVTLGLGENGRVTDVEIGATRPMSGNCVMDVYYLDKSLLQYLVDVSVSHGKFNFNREVLQKRVQDLKIYGYKHNGYVSRLDSVNAFYALNMDLLDVNIRRELLMAPRPVLTKVKNEVPAYYAQGASSVNSLVADGCVIEGDVENCVLFRGVHIGKGAVVKNSILMQATEVDRDARLNYIVADKNVRIGAGRSLSGQPAFPIVIRKNAIV